MIEQSDLRVLRFFDTDRYVLQRGDGQELAVLAHGLPGEASLNGRRVQLTAVRRDRRLAVKAADGETELGRIELSWLPGRYRIRIRDSVFGVAQRWLRGGWNVSRDGVRLATVDLNGWFSSGVHVNGNRHIEAGNVTIGDGPLLNSDVQLALVLLLEMLAYDSIQLPRVSA
jgi:hypothetical protein